MLTIDPFRPPARHRKRTLRRYMTGTLELIAAGIVAALMFWVLTAASGEAPAVWPGQVTRAATRAVAGFTPSARPITPGHVSRAATGHAGTR